MNRLLKTLAAAALAVMPLTALAQHQLSSAQPSLSEDFNSTWNGTEATLTMPDGWRVERNTSAPRKVSAWTDASSELMYAGGTSLASNAKNGTWNFGDSSNPADRAIGGLTTGVANATRGINVMTAIHNADPSLIINSLAIDYNVEKYRKGANAAGFAVTLYYSTDGTTWEKAGDDFLTKFDADTETIGDAVVPISTTGVSGKSLRVHVEAGQDLYLAWNISVASGSTCDKAMGLSVDDIAIRANFVETDDEWQDPVNPDVPAADPSGIYLRGEVNGWAADEEWNFNKTDDPDVYVLYNKELSGQFKVADANWSSTCNYGSNGTNMMMDEPYQLVAGTDSNISCGTIVFDCKRIILTIKDGQASLLLEGNDAEGDLTSVYMMGDFNNWNYMDRSGELKLDAASGLFKGRVSMTAGGDGLSRWLVYQRLGMAGPWGLASDAAEASLSGNLVKGEKGKAAAEAGTYDVTFSLTDGAYTLTKVAAVATDMTINPQQALLVPTLPESVKVLSLNNSLIHYSDQPTMFNNIAKTAGSDAVWTRHTLLGKSLATHWDEGDGLAGDGQPGAKMMVRFEAWSHIILQEQSSLPRTNLATFRANVERWVNYIRTTCPNPNAVIILPVNWAYSSDWDNFSNFNSQFIANYKKVADEFGVIICPVISAYQNVYDAEGQEGIAPWFLDDRHPTDMSAYMAACMEYGLIYGVDPVSAITWKPSTVSDEDAAKMRRYASEALKGWNATIDHHAGKVRFSATVTDEFGMPMDAGEVTFTVDNGGEMNADNEFITTTPGVYNVTATNGQFTRSCKVTVAEPVTVKIETPSIPLSENEMEYSQNFDAMGAEAGAKMPEGWRIDRQTSGPRTVGSFNAAVDAPTYAGGVSLPSNAKNGTWNFGDNAGTDRAVGGITTGVADGSRAINVYAHFLNDGKKELSTLSLAYNVEKYRDGNNGAGFTVKLYTSADGVSWTEAGADFVTDFEPSAATAGFETVPGQTVAVAGTLPVGIQPGCDLYLAWNISVTSGTNCAGAPALAIDDVVLKGELAPVPVYAYHIYVEDKTGYASMGAYAYGDKEIWGAWPGQAPIDEQTVDGVTYKVFGHDEATGSYNLILNNWNNSLQLPDFPFQGGRDYYLLATDSTVTEKTGVGTVVDTLDTESPAIIYRDGAARCDGAALTVFSTTGMAVAAGADSVDMAQLPAGVYVVTASRDALRATACILKR